MLARVLRRLPADVLLLVTVLFWSFNFTVWSVTYRPYELGAPPLSSGGSRSF